VASTFDPSWMELPSKETWEIRRQWFESLENSFLNERASYGLSDQACALVGEVQTVFCSGAWVTVLIMAIAVIESHVGEFGYSDLNNNPTFQKLRKRRNSIVHFQDKHPGISVDQQWSDRVKLETEAKEAVNIMFGVFYSDVGT
jgi:hypothetical protein